MKLIDADSIPWDVAGVGDIPVITKEEIDDMPTVQAIPIEWLRKHMITYYEVVNGDYYADEAMELNLYVSDLIEKWYAERNGQ